MNVIGMWSGFEKSVNVQSNHIKANFGRKIIKIIKTTTIKQLLKTMMKSQQIKSFVALMLCGIASAKHELPKDNCCILYEKTNFQGEYIKKCVDEEIELQFDTNTKINSMHCGYDIAFEHYNTKDGEYFNLKCWEYAGIEKLCGYHSYFGAGFYKNADLNASHIEQSSFNFARINSIEQNAVTFFE